jgi:O-antigen ligase
VKTKLLAKGAVPALILAALLLGGSAQAIWGNALLQLLSVALIGWAGWRGQPEGGTSASRSLLVLLLLVLVLILAQLVPLPPELWTAMRGREFVRMGFGAMNQPLPWLPLSVASYATLSTVTTLLVPVAVLLGMLRLRAYRERWIAAVIVGGALLGVALGAVQTIGGLQPGAWYYPYRFSNDGAVGFFANRNHMGTLLLAAIPFLAALLATSGVRERVGARSSGLLVLAAGAAVLLGMGLALNQSLAAAALAVPVILLSAALFAGTGRKARALVAAALVLALGAVLLFAATPIPDEIAGRNTVSLDSRREIWSLTLSASVANFPFGTGLGTFPEVYRLFEAQSGVSPIYVTHAHNDFLEIALELGLPGLLLLGAFLLWWTHRAAAVWRSPLSSHCARAAIVASAAILAHSLVDYPLRTAAIVSVFAACLAMIAQPMHRRGSDPAEVRPTRHVRLG